ncbi:MAG TPA: hypothetical protein PLL30_08240 [Candidatus Krumholzibacteria bacterium]|nr:hypothetical protein [Candidatus Krumholzibacteria bacterium]HPD71746.1 hypothetical protein [Candidatus Krumholzibacteria bacterium]HRY41321.1 hypothetical protein [Candidatus Krumholzibacteria bacterium]
MSFSPLPATFIDDLRRSSAAGVLELGSGDGSFTAVIRELGREPLTVDRSCWPAGSRPRIRGDALAPPLRRRFDVVVAANLLRQLWRDLPAAGPGVWRDLVDRDGSLWIFEDEPLASPRAARNYRDLQAMLAQAGATGRRELVPLAEFRRRRRVWAWNGEWTCGQAVNEWEVAAAGVIAWLASGDPEPATEMACLMQRIQRDGLSYGCYWWARWRPEAAGC